MYNNAADYDSLADAIRASTNKRLYIPYDVGGKHTTPGWFCPDANGWTLDQPIEIFGDSRNGEDVGLRYWADPNVPNLMGTGNSTIFNVTGNNVYLHDLCLSNDRGNVDGTGNAIKFTAPMVYRNIFLERVDMLYAGDVGLKISPSLSATNETGYMIVSEVKDCVVFGCGGRGVEIDGASTTLTFKNVNIVGNGGVGFWVRNCSTSNFDVISEGNCNKVLTDPYPCAIYFRACTATKLKCHIEQFANGNTKDGIVIDGCVAVKVETSGIYDYHNLPGLTGIRLNNGSNRNIVESCHQVGVDMAVFIGPESGDNVVFHQSLPGKLNVAPVNIIIANPPPPTPVYIPRHGNSGK